MSFDVSLQRNNQTVTVEPHSEGNVHVLFGDNRAELNVTFNLSRHFFNALDNEQGLRWLSGRRAGDCLNRLQDAVELLSDNASNDCWANTLGNAGHALAVLMEWAANNQDAVFTVS